MPCSWRRLAAPSPREGGPYEWTKLAFGRLQGAIAAVPYWVTNPLWVGGSLAFIATEAWSENLFNIGSGSAGDYIFKGLFIWLSIGVAIVSLRRGKWIPNVGAFLRVFVLGVFTVTTIIYAFNHGVSGFPIGDLKPTVAVFLALVPLLLFNYGGFELQNGAAEEMENPRRDVPVAVVRSAITGVLPMRSRSSRSSSCYRPIRSPASAASSTRSPRRSASTAARSSFCSAS
jgi:glutamate:GABA antiporter